VAPGQLDRLEAEFAVHKETEPRVLPASSQGYARPGPPPAPPIPRGLFEPDGSRWVLLARAGGPALPLTAAVGAAGALRRCLLGFAGTPSPRLISGHLPDGRPDDHPHLAVLPLAFLGHRHADGLIKGFALVPPAGCPVEALDCVLDALAAWEDASADDDAAGLPLHLGRAGVLSLRRIEADEAPWTLRPSKGATCARWCRGGSRSASTYWSADTCRRGSLPCALCRTGWSLLTCKRCC
jgi:CRISPR-associated protein Csb2